MEQRRLRLGDTLDDYCPRERRVTNHAIVAMIEEDIKQTRCTTCDTEHAYKGAKVPRRRKKETSATLYGEVLAGMQPDGAAATSNGHLAAPRVDTDPVELNSAPMADTSEAAVTDDRTTTPAAEPDDSLQASSVSDDDSVSRSIEGAPAEDGPVHRPLIRATLPRPEGQKDTRPVPEFTIRQPGGRGNGFRGSDPRMKMRQGHGGGNGNRAHGGPRFGAGPGRGTGRGGPSAGFRGQGQQRQGGGGRKRSR